MKEVIKNALDNTKKMIPKKATIACQGIEGANSQTATERLFAEPSIMYFKNFEGVFQAVDKGLCDYGVLPVENSTAGSVNATYDLMMKYKFFIIKSVRVKIDHNLLAVPGAKIEEIKEIYSHEQAIAQCSEFLKEHEIITHTCENTAVAAKKVSELGRKDIAALSSISCAGLYNLECLEKSVQDKGNNYTRFICISKDVQIYPGADRTSIMAVLPHKPGSLYGALKIFVDAGYNLIKLESRPMPDRDFEFMFYFDFETSVYEDNFAEVLETFNDYCDEFQYLGSYLEVL